MPTWAYRKKRWQERGTCIDCRNQSVKPTLRCTACAKRRRITQAKVRKGNPKLYTAIARKWRAKNRTKGLCQRCTKPLPPTSKTRCEFNLVEARDLAYKQAGIFSLRKPEIIKRRQELVLKDLKAQPVLKDKWNEVESWIKDHIDIFVDKTDHCLFNAFPI